MVIDVDEKVKISYEVPKGWKKKRTGKELLEDYSNMNLEQLMEKRDKEQLELRYKYYSRVDFLSKKVIKLEDKLKILEEVVLKFIDDNTDARTSFKRWFKRRGEQQK